MPCLRGEISGQLIHGRAPLQGHKKEMGIIGGHVHEHPCFPLSLASPPAAYELLWLQHISQQTDPTAGRYTANDPITHLVCNFDKEAESLGGLEEQAGSDVLAEVLGLGAGLHLEGLGGGVGGLLGSGWTF